MEDNNTEDKLKASLLEENTCGVCCDLMVKPTTLNCGHSYCRHCLAKWFELGKKFECPTCRQAFSGLPMINVKMKSSLLTLFPDKYSKRQKEVLEDATNSAAIDRFEEIIKDRHKSDELKDLSSGFLFGVILCLIFSVGFYFAFHWGSSENLLVNKPLLKWTQDDVCYWLDDIGLESYKQTFLDNNINGRLLSEVEPSDLEELFHMNNSLHRRLFLQSLNYTKIHGIKAPTNFWEYRSLYPGYTSFLLYSMGHTPRLSLLYLYKYDEESFNFYMNMILDCQSTDSQSVLYMPLILGLLATPHYINFRFVRCFLDLHYWTSRLLITQCLIKSLIDAFNFISFIRNFSSSSVKDTVTESLLMMCVYYIVSCVWWLIPTIIRDTLFYAELYFSPIFYLKELYSLLRSAD